MTARPDAVLFDAGGTLVLQHPRRMGSILGLEIAEDAAFDAHYRTMAEFSRLRLGGGDTTWDWWLERYFERLGHPAPAEAGPAIDRGYGLWTWPIPGVVGALLRLRAEGLRVAVVSNSDGSVAASLAAAGFAGAFEFVLDSEVVGAKKPEPVIFALAVDRLGVDARRVWYVGDSEFHDVGGARAAGLAGTWLVDPLDLHPGHPHRIRSVTDLPALLLD
jgi:putative hydrolase of the HAD superfamily